MHKSLTASYASLKTNPLVFDKKDVIFVDPSAPNNPAIMWAIEAFGNLIPIMEKIFPHLHVEYAIEDVEKPNAWICPCEADSFIIAVTSGAISEFINTANAFSNDLLSIGLSKEEAALFSMIKTLRFPSEGGFDNRGAEIFASGALGAIIGHELGHAYERQFEIETPEKSLLLINHGAEFAADYWSIHITGALLAPVFDIARENAETSSHIFAADLLQAQFILGAFSCLDRIDLNIRWLPENLLDNKITHPVDAARLLFAAIAMVEWWSEANVRPAQIANNISVLALERILRYRNLANPSTKPDELLKQMLDNHDSSENYLKDCRARYLSWKHGS